MKIKYDKETDILYIKLSDLAIAESDVDKKGVILDYTADGQLAGIEILEASKSTIQPSKIEYESV
ncbi:DUF2283 domain-containing protein [Dyadobacter subterraneus]|uniref:DUF2283 domain-containing protein n=1 Tax=Dyadobacter subterraneus TaxID=2773304 RepID=A0ABR9W4U9_9BACT|nr:DUF2283 domain-containing protein [Dyadobacter subterraneus]MBE9460484.1 DUF2283 domain-containing protein [Dyadobacter subterraneus]